MSQLQISADAAPVKLQAISRFQVASVRSATADRRRREQELRRALAAGELSLSFAARMPLAASGAGAAEAVIRWPHRRRGLTPSADFMPLAKTAGLALQVGGWMLQEACAAAADWANGTAVCVDLVGGLLEQDGLLDQVAAALASSGLAPERLEIELQEVDLETCPDENLLRLAALRDLGVGVALDAFGAGAASLTLLKRMPLTTLVFDASMLRDLALDREDRAMLQASIQVAHALGLVTVATGIETEEQRSILGGMACDAGQGPLFGPPFASGWSGVLPPNLEALSVEVPHFGFAPAF